MFLNCISALAYPPNSNINSSIEENINFYNYIYNKKLKNVSNINESNNKYEEELKNLLIKYNNITESSTKNKIKGVLKIELNEINKNLVLFQSIINNGIDVYLNGEKLI